MGKFLPGVTLLYAGYVSNSYAADCQMIPGTSYTLHVYIEACTSSASNYTVDASSPEGSCANDGVLDQVQFSVPSNTFAAPSPALPNGGTPQASAVSDDGFTITFTPTVAGYFWAIVMESSVYNPSIQATAVKDGTNALGNASCQYYTEAITVNTITKTFSGCGLSRTVTYKLLMYLDSDLDGENATRRLVGLRDEGDYETDGEIARRRLVTLNDGTLIDVDIYVPASNLFKGTNYQPQVGTPGFITTDGIPELTFTPTENGYMWGVLMTSAYAAVATASTVKAGVNAIGDSTTCRYTQLPLTADTQFNGAALTGCSLSKGTTYKMVVYIVDMSAGDDGTVFSVDVLVPASNTLTQGPTISLVSIDGFTLGYTPSATGRVWGLVTIVAHAPSLTITMIKAGTYALGGSACRQDAVPVAANSLVLRVFQGCGMVAGETYTYTVYAEDLNSGDDGMTYTTPIIVPSSGLVSGDPVTYHGDEKTEFVLPQYKLTSLLAMPDLNVLAEPLPGDGRPEQWIGRVLVTTRDTKPETVVDVRIKKHLQFFNRTTTHPNAFESIDVSLEWFEPYPRLRLLPPHDTYFTHHTGARVFAGRLRHVHEELNLRVPRRELALIVGKYAKVAVFSASAHEYFGTDGAHQDLGRHYAHLDVEVLDIVRGQETFEGVLPELWGYRPISNETRAMVKSAPEDLDDKFAVSEKSVEF